MLYIELTILLVSLSQKMLKRKESQWYTKENIAEVEKFC